MTQFDGDAVRGQPPPTPICEQYTQEPFVPEVCHDESIDDMEKSKAGMNALLKPINQTDVTDSLAISYMEKGNIRWTYDFERI